MNRGEAGKIPFSVAIITRNEEARLADCLESVSFAEDLVVVDSDSTDRTVEIAKSYGARVFIEPWQGFSYQKQYAVNQCKHDWVLILDADERIPQESVTQIAQVLKDSSLKVCGFSFRRRNFFHGRWIKHCGWWPNQVLRLVDKRKGVFDGRAVHEGWIAQGPITALDTEIVHLSYRSYSELIDKMDRYSSIGAEDLYQKNKQTGALKPISRGIWMFCKTYFLQKGFLDGFDGLVISLMNAAGSFFKYAKHRELTKYGRDKLHQP
ncbi:MAG: glycosyltransferase family 2 protein [Proteobacteria bacterium]|nr:glycosyltransferase family 2 protein [Pseudomonadota bacterium]MBU1710202.1 glycosyltransferase family 2 protein [Pseudomonadota bacterium]